ncbi:MAG TPA: AAA family ATPase [Puia sp.]|jgi:predicted ATPase|nr:AAA family ATPase [Puia sp.]
MDNLTVTSLGPIKKADINFKDLTLLVGPQASGKSIFLQLLKLIIDKKHIRRTLQQYGFIWGNDTNQILDRYFGEGMHDIWTGKTKVLFDGDEFPINFLLPKKAESIKNAIETLFYIPAQRIVCLQNGWPRFFTEYEDSVPYILRHFSETLRQFLERGVDKEAEVIFPQNNRLKAPLRNSFNESIFHDGKIIIDKSNKKRFKLSFGKSTIPFMTWSAGQKEFMPLLLSFYWLSPSAKVSRKDEIKYVVIEEPEMGLHPQAIKSVLLQIIDLISRDYKVIVSTHSPVLLEFAWAFNSLKVNKASSDEFYDLFSLKKTTATIRLFEDLLEQKEVNTYYFDRQDHEVVVKDISSLDAGSTDTSISEWGGLSSFSAKAAEIIANSVAQNEK